MTSALDRVMGQAADAAANFQAPANVAQTQLQTTSPNALSKPSMEAFGESGGMTVDNYLTPREAGLQIGDMKGYFDTATVEIEMKDVIPVYSARGEAGGNTKFIKSYDGVTTPQGQNFQQAVAHLEATTKCSGIYQTVEIPMTLLEDVTDGKGTTVTKGTTLGLTPSVTGFKHFQSFYREMKKVGNESACLKVKLDHLLRTNRNNNKWGVVEFELLEKLD